MIEGLKPYPKYKNSGQPWLGAVPAEWDVRRGKWLFQNRKELNTYRANKNVLSLTLRGVVNNDPDDPEGLVPKDYATYQLFKKGDLVFKLIDLENLRTSRVGLVHEDGIMSSAYVRLIPRNGGNIRFFFHQYFDLYARGVYNQIGAGVRSTLGAPDLLDVGILVPPREEQHAIVRFLDHANGRIERAIRAKKKLIALLNEQKQATTHHAVTRSLAPNVPLKFSDIPWLGDIPKHWDVLRSKYVFREVDDRSATGQETRLSMSQKLGLVPSSKIEVKRLVSESAVGSKICETGDLVLNRLKAHLGVFALASVRGLVSPDYTILRPARAMCPRYFELIYRTPACRVELRKRAKGIVQGFWRLYTDDFYDIRVPVPPVPEQERIVKQLDVDLIALNTATARTEREIELLREYRTRLVADVVTGQLDVRDAAIKLPDENLVDAETISDPGNVEPEEVAFAEVEG